MNMKLITERMKDPTFDRTGRPTEETLNFIENYDCRTRVNREYLLDFVRWAWDTRAGTAAHRFHPPPVQLRLKPGIEPGNMELISALRQNIELWTICFVGSEPNGTYIFIPGREG